MTKMTLVSMIQVQMIRFSHSLQYFQITSTVACLLKTQTVMLNQTQTSIKIQVIMTHCLLLPLQHHTFWKQWIHTSSLVTMWIPCPSSGALELTTCSWRHSLLYSCAVRDRIDFSHLSEKFSDPVSLPCVDDVTSSFLPSAKDDRAVQKHFAILLSQEQHSTNHKLCGRT